METLTTSTISFKTKVALFITVTFWASAFVGIRAGLQSYSPGGLACLRFLIASSVMWVFYSKFSMRSGIVLKDKILLLLIGASGIGWYNITLNYGELSVPSGIASFIISQSPILTSLIAVFFLSEKLSFFGFCGMLVSVFGVLLITLGQTQEFHSNMGIFYIFIATLIGGLYSVIQKPFLKKYNAIEVTAYLVWGGTLMLAIYLPALGHDVANASLSATLAVVYLGIFPGAIAYIGWSFILAEIPAARAVSFLYFMPIIATILGWVWLDEMPLFISLCGGLVALSGVWLVNKSYLIK